MNLAFLKNLQLHTYHPTESISPQPLTHDQSVFYLQHQTFHFIKLPFLLPLPFPPFSHRVAFSWNVFSETKRRGAIKKKKSPPMQSAVVLLGRIMGNWERVFNRKPTCNATVVKVRLTQPVTLRRGGLQLAFSPFWSHQLPDKWWWLHEAVLETIECVLFVLGCDLSLVKESADLTESECRKAVTGNWRVM